MFDKKPNFVPINNRFLFLDMNSFFASCEQQNNPYYQNKPLVVAPFSGNTGTVIASSWEAKQYGITTGMKIWQAKQLYPKIIITDTQPDLYRKIHREIIAIMGDFSPWLKVKSIDELAIPLSPSERLGDRPYQIGQAIKRAFQANLGPYLTCSIGIGPNIFLAKQASNITKKDGLETLNLDTLEPFYRQVKLGDLTGIARGMTTRLNQMGIANSHQFYMASKTQLRQKLGITGEYWFLKLHGYPIEDLQTSQHKSLSHSHVLSPEQRNWPIAQKTLKVLAHRLGERLRNNQLTTQNISLKLSFWDQPSWFKQIKTQPFQDNFQLFSFLQTLWETIPKTQPPFKITLTVSHLNRQSVEQLNMFEIQPKTQRLNRIVDKINRQSKRTIIYPAILFEANNLAPDSIAFGRTR
jgi:DNA polymerase-4